MPGRKVSLVNGEFYHIYTKSIAGFRIFNTRDDFERMTGALRYYEPIDFPISYSKYLELCCDGPLCFPEPAKNDPKLVDIVAFCLMETHIHLILRQSQANGISDYMKLLLNSYSRYFNKKYKRKGPLWEGRFGSVRVSDDDHLLLLTRYIHLNPVTAGLVAAPEKWEFSSYNEYISSPNSNNLCTFSPYIDIDKKSYAAFVNDHIEHQKNLAKIKYLLLERADTL